MENQNLNSKAGKNLRVVEITTDPKLSLEKHNNTVSFGKRPFFLIQKRLHPAGPLRSEKTRNPDHRHGCSRIAQTS